MSPSLQQARLVISLDKPTPSLRAVLSLASQRPALQGLEPADRSAETTESEPAVPESYIREIAPYFDAASQIEIEEELELIGSLERERDLPIGLDEPWRVCPPLPTVHPFLNRDTQLEDLPVLGPPKISILVWIWLAITCSL